MSQQPNTFTEVGSSQLTAATQLYTQLLAAGATPVDNKFTLQSLYNFFRDTAGFGFGSTVKRRQFFPASSDLSLFITVDVGTLPADNNDITVTVGGLRILPDQGSIQLGWTRNPLIDPAQIFIRARDNEIVLVEW